MSSQARLVNSAGAVLTSNLLHQRERERETVCIYFNCCHYSHRSDGKVWSQDQSVLASEESWRSSSTVKVCQSSGRAEQSDCQMSLSVCASCPWRVRVLVHWKLPGGETGRGSLFRGLTWSLVCNNLQYRNVLCSQIFPLYFNSTRYIKIFRFILLQHKEVVENLLVFSWIESHNQLTNGSNVLFLYIETFN